MTKQTTLGFSGLAIGLIAAVATLVLFIGTALAAGTVSVDSPTSAANGDATVTLTAAAPTGNGIGNWQFEVVFDPAKQASAPSCQAVASGGGCNVEPGGATGTIRFAGATGETAGLTGNVNIGTSLFHTNLAAGACTPITITITSFQDQNATDFSAPTKTNGQICAPAAATTAAATTAAASGTAAATTAAALPKTGGPSSDSSFQLGWLAAAAGALIVVAAGAWTLARAREDS